MNSLLLNRVIPAVAGLIFLTASISRGGEGFASEATGGEGGRVVTPRTAEEFKALANSEEKLVIRVEGALAVGVAPVRSNKTILGTDKSATIIGTLMIGNWVSNVIVRNLNVTNPMNKKGKGGGDGITVRPARQVWIDHCTFYDCGDGCVDVTDGSDYVTVSWCKFYYTKQPQHRFTMLAIGREKKKSKNKLKITLHHNWWAEKCDQRMPAARKARVHMYNNYFSCSGNSYCTDARPDTELLSENNYYEKVQNPCYGEGKARLKINGNIYQDCTGKISRSQDNVFTPPYEYSLDDAKKVPEIVRRGAGAH